MWDSCAATGPGPARMVIKTRAIRFALRVRILSSISEVEADEKTAGGQIARGDGRGAALPQDRVFVVKSEARAAGNKWIETISDCDGVNVAEVCRVRREHLARHPNRLVPADQDESRIEVVMRFDQAAVPRGSPRARRKRHIGRSV